MTDIKTTEYLRYDFLARELAEHAKALARKNQQLAELELKKKRLMADIKAEMEQANAEIGILSRWVNDGYDYREIDCVIRLNDPTRGRKTVIRLDSGEIVKTLNMLPSELQEELPFSDEATAG